MRVKLRSMRELHDNEEGKQKFVKYRSVYGTEQERQSNDAIALS